MGKTKVAKNYSENDQKENSSKRSRKRKASGQLNPGKSKQNIGQRNDLHLYKEMGVDSLSSDSDSSNSYTELTPCITVNSGSRIAPGAPRVLLPSQKENTLDTTINEDYESSPTSSSSFLSLISSSITCKRKIYLPENDYFSEMSDEIVLCIFRWLPKFTLAKCARVCHRWKRLVMDESLWKRIDLANRVVSPDTLFHVLKRGVQILRLTKTEIEGISQPSPTLTLRNTRHYKVQYLDLSMSSLSVPMLEDLLYVCKDLKKLSLEHCEVSDKVCQFIGGNKELEVLNMSMCQGITANGLMPIATNCKNLESLNLAWTSLHRHSVVYLSLCLPSNLHKLNISGCRENITDEEILQLCSTCPYLKELDLSDSTVLTCSSINYITDNLHHLEYLALSRNYRIMPQTIMLLKKMDALLAIDLFGMFREGALQQLREDMPHLEVNRFPFSNIARPTTGIRRTSIWGLRVRETVI